MREDIFPPVSQSAGVWRQFLCRVGTRRQEVIQTLDKSCTIPSILSGPSLIRSSPPFNQKIFATHTQSGSRTQRAKKKSPPKTSPVSVRARSHSWRKKRRRGRGGIGDQGHSTISAALTVRLLLCAVGDVGVVASSLVPPTSSAVFGFGFFLGRPKKCRIQARFSFILRT